MGRQSRVRFGFLVPCALSLFGCSGSISASGGDDSGGNQGNGAGGAGANSTPLPDTIPDPVASCDEDESRALPVGLKRLSRREFENTLRDLFPGLNLGTIALTPDQDTLGFENRAHDLFATNQNVTEFQRTAVDVAAKVMANPALVLPCQTEDAACGAKFIATFGRRAFRRPLTAEETTRYETYFKQQLTDLDFKTAVQLVIEGMLQSAHFLYRPEFGDAATEADGTRRVTGYEMASRLSYFIWASMPDADLFAAAEDGLKDEGAVLEQAQRMLGDDKARGQMIDFHRQWLNYDHVTDIWKKEGPKEPTRYGAYNAAMADSMRQEMDRFTGQIMFDGSRTVADLLSSRETFVDKTLAPVYGVPAPADDWAPVTLPEGERSGLLTRAAFLASHAHKLSGSPPLRGVYVMDRLLCLPKQMPDPSADTSEPVAKPGEAARTNRALFEERVANGGTCKTCHQFIDPMGFVFENYDAMGRFRTEDNGLPIDATGAVTASDVDGDVANAIEFSERLATSKDVVACMTGNWFQFAIGRDTTDGESCKLEGLKKAVLGAKGDVRALQLAIIRSPDFQFQAQP